MKIARVAVLTVACGAAIGAALMARNMLVREPVPAQQIVQNVSNIATGSVLVAAEDIPLGTTVTARFLRWQEWPEEAISEFFVTKENMPNAMEEIAGSIARSVVLGGEPINQHKLVKADRGGFMSAILASGMRAISTRISPETGAGGFILPNDRVDVLLTRKEDRQELGSDSQFLSETILRNVRVLAIDQTIGEENGEQVVVGKTATLELSGDQSEILALAGQRGEISLSLRSLVDSTDGDGGPETVSGRGNAVRVMRFGVTSHSTASR
ncbi:MAG: Flp pilus assembly protein CpaB [Fimbriimonadaceae bacterium]|nr:Flp pilus assembly protein CpaB [Alphaproteobacteria bacterium]